MNKIGSKNYVSLPCGISDIKRYFTRETTPGRILLDRFMVEEVPKLSGEVLELGSGGLGRSEIAIEADRYVLSNYAERPNMLILDARDMDLPDSSFDAVVSEVMLEHVDKPFEVISEVLRVLRPGGTFVLVVPWMYPFHAAPDDYYRFSKSALYSMLDSFDVQKVEPVGGLWSTISLFLQLRVWPWTKPKTGLRWWRAFLFGLPILMLGFCFYISAKFGDGSDDYPLLFGVIAKKASV
jgi:SAM-dependent methyltransferase